MLLAEQLVRQRYVRPGPLVLGRQVIASLEAEDRKLIYLRYFQNKTQMETAKQLGMSQVQVSRREKKLLTLMREQLK